MNKNNSFFIFIIVLVIFTSWTDDIYYQLQSYDVFLTVVSVAYGKYVEKTERETAMNQWIIKKRTLCPMEKTNEGMEREQQSKQKLKKSLAVWLKTFTFATE